MRKSVFVINGAQRGADRSSNGIFDSEKPKLKKSGHLPVHGAIFAAKIAELFLCFRLFATRCATPAFILCLAAGFLNLNCGPSYCKQYVTKNCSDEKSPVCAQAKEKAKNWSSKECRIQLNNQAIEEQSQQLDKVLDQ